MPDAGAPQTGDALLSYVKEVADHLPEDGVQRRLVVVGGALMAWRGLRDATRDVDSCEQLDSELRAAVAAVAEHNGLAPRWINDAASRFTPAGFNLDEASEIFVHPRLRVLGASLDQVFLMKILAGRATDTDDLRALWPHTSFDQADQAAQAFQDAYPHESVDVHLSKWIDDVIVG